MQDFSQISVYHTRDAFKIVLLNMIYKVELDSHTRV